MLDPRFKEVNSVNDFKVVMRTWQGGECNVCLYVCCRAASNVMISYVISSICHCIYHFSSSLPFNRSSIFSHLFISHCRQVVLCTNVFLVTQTDVK